MSYLIDTGYACFWIETDEYGVVVKTPPIARWMIDHSYTEIRRWVFRNNHEMTPL